MVAEGEDQKLREKQWDENEPLRHFCRYNRITKLKFVQSADLYEQLEVFQEMIFELSSATFFPNLVELWVMDQAYTVKNLHGLENCSKLRVLNVTQCDLTSLDGLETLTGLRKLIVHSNKLTSLLGVQPLVNLEELIVHSNQVRAFFYFFYFIFLHLCLPSLRCECLCMIDLCFVALGVCGLQRSVLSATIIEVAAICC